MTLRQPPPTPAPLFDADAAAIGARLAYCPPPDWPFYLAFGTIAGVYVLVIVLMILADTGYTSWWHIHKTLADPAVQYSIKLSLASCTITAALSVVVAVPIGYLLSRHILPTHRSLTHRRDSGARSRPARVALTALCGLVDAVLDIPIVLPPLVIGLSLLILFRFRPFVFLDRWVTYQVPAVILAQFMVACAFAVRTMRVTFDQIDPRREMVALTLGCSRAQAFFRVALPEATRGVLAAGTLAWARALGEFGPILVFAGATRMKTEVLSTTVFLELSIGRLEAAVAVSLLMVAAAAIVLIVMRLFGLRSTAMGADAG